MYNIYLYDDLFCCGFYTSSITEMVRKGVFGGNGFRVCAEEWQPVNYAFEIYQSHNSHMTLIGFADQDCGNTTTLLKFLSKTYEDRTFFVKYINPRSVNEMLNESTKQTPDIRFCTSCKFNIPSNPKIARDYSPRCSSPAVNLQNINYMTFGESIANYQILTIARKDVCGIEGKFWEAK